VDKNTIEVLAHRAGLARALAEFPDDVAISATYGQPSGNGVGQWVTPSGTIIKIYP
jgi:hypothetical protein